MEKKLPEFKPLPELGNVASNYMSAFNVGMNIYEALAYLQGYVQLTYNSVNDLIDDWNNFENYVTENINQIANEKTQEILQGWLDDGTLAETIKQSAIWAEKVDVAGDVMSGDLQFQENTGVYGTLHSGTKVNMISHSYTGTDDYTQIGDSNSQSVVRSKNRPVWYDGSQNHDLLVEEDLPSKENLLDNADFKSGIINQRGKTTYEQTSKWTGSIDRWLYISYGPIAVTEGYIQIGPSASNQTTYFRQKLPKTINGELTCAVQVKNLIGTCKMNFSTTYVDKEIHEGLNIINIPANQNVDTVQFNLEGANSQIQIEFVKLEHGSVFTGMPEWDFVSEWFNCQKYLYVARTTYTQYQESNIISGYIAMPCPMVKVPSLFELYLNNVFNSQEIARETDISQFSVGTSFLSDITLSKNIPVGTYALSAAFDAELY